MDQQLVPMSAANVHHASPRGDDTNFMVVIYHNISPVKLGNLTNNQHYTNVLDIKFPAKTPGRAKFSLSLRRIYLARWRQNAQGSLPC